MSSYQYRPIHHQQHAFRLVHLRAGTGIDIECELVHASLNEDDLIPYEALSYTWGPPQHNDIKVDGQKMAVTVNLYGALYHLRQPDQDRILWIDAICINQDSDTEKAHQVQQMRTIYSKAEQVVIYLGTLDDDASLLMRSLASFEKLVRGMKLNESNRSSWSGKWGNVEKQTMAWHKDVHDSHTAGLALLLSKPWFRRGWIIQEVANARRAIVQCDSRSVSSKVFAISPLLLDFQVDSHTVAILELMAGPRERPSWWSGKRDLRTLLHRFSLAETTIGRDRLFSLLGICDETEAEVEGRGVIKADYDAPEEAIIKSATAILFNCPEGLLQETIFRSVEHLLSNFAVSGQLLLHRQVSIGGTANLRELLDSNSALKAHADTIILALTRTNETLKQIFKPASDWSSADGELNAADEKKLKTILEDEMDTITILLQHRSGDFEIKAPALIQMMEIATERLQKADLWSGTKYRETLDKGDVLTFILDSVPDKLQINDEVLIAAAEQDKEVQKRIFYYARTEVTAKVFNDTTRLIDVELFQNLTDRGLLPITDETLEAACQFSQPELAKYLLERGSGQITQRALVAAAHQENRDLVDLIMSSGAAEITEDILLTACRYSNAKMVAYLLGMGARCNHVTNDVITAAVGRGPYAARMIASLLRCSSRDLFLTGEILTAVAGNKRTGLRALQLLLQHGARCCTVSKSIVNAALSQVSDASQVTRYDAFEESTDDDEPSKAADDPTSHQSADAPSILGVMLQSVRGSTHELPFTTQAFFDAVIDKTHSLELLPLFLGCVFDDSDDFSDEYRYEVAKVAFVGMTHQREYRAQMVQTALKYVAKYVKLSEIFPDSGPTSQRICDMLRHKLNITSDADQDLIQAIVDSSNLSILNSVLVEPLKRVRS